MYETIEYTVTGVSKQDGKQYLIHLCGRDEELAERTLNKTKKDKNMMNTYTHIFIQKHAFEERW